MARGRADERTAGYRAKSLKIHPGVCARCGREFSHETLSELTVHHKDHNHDNNPENGANWENLCVYCHDNEHARYHDHLSAEGVTMAQEVETAATFNPFSQLQELLNRRQG